MQSVNITSRSTIIIDIIVSVSVRDVGDRL